MMTIISPSHYDHIMMIQLNGLPSLGLPVGGAVRVAAVQLKPFLRRERLVGGGASPREVLHLPGIGIGWSFEINLELDEGVKVKQPKPFLQPAGGAADERSKL